MSNYPNHQRLRLRVIGEEDEAVRFIQQLEKFLGTRLYPSPPEPDRTYGGVRIYVEVPSVKLQAETSPELTSSE